jgi:hypothetical protein
MKNFLSSQLLFGALLVLGVFVGIYTIKNIPCKGISSPWDMPRPLVVDRHAYTAWDQIGANPEDTLRARENAHTIPYVIHNDPSQKEVIVNFPTFLEQSL